MQASTDGQAQPVGPPSNTAAAQGCAPDAASGSENQESNGIAASNSDAQAEALHQDPGGMRPAIRRLQEDEQVPWEPILYDVPEPVKEHESVLCAICLELFQNPHIWNGCGHTFCLSCIRDHVKTNQHCPACRKPYTGETLNLTMKEQLEHVQVRCPNHGCPWQGPKKEVDVHCKTCPKGLFRCGLPASPHIAASTCEEACSLEEQAAHRKKCVFVRVECSCGDVMARLHWEEHRVADCLHHRKRCSTCYVKLTRAALRQHQCPKAEVTCVTCGDRMRREQLEEHNTRMLQEHVQEISQALCAAFGVGSVRELAGWRWGVRDAAPASMGSPLPDFGLGMEGVGMDGKGFAGKGMAFGGKGFLGKGTGLEGKGLAGKGVGLDGKGFVGKGTGLDGKGFVGKGMGMDGKGFVGKGMGMDGKGVGSKGIGMEGKGFGGKGVGAGGRLLSWASEFGRGSLSRRFDDISASPLSPPRFRPYSPPYSPPGPTPRFPDSPYYSPPSPSYFVDLDSPVYSPPFPDSPVSPVYSPATDSSGYSPASPSPQRDRRRSSRRSDSPALDRRPKRRKR